MKKQFRSNDGKFASFNTALRIIVQELRQMTDLFNSVRAEEMTIYLDLINCSSPKIKFQTPWDNGEITLKSFDTEVQAVYEPNADLVEFLELYMTQRAFFLANYSKKEVELQSIVEKIIKE